MTFFAKYKKIHCKYFPKYLHVCECVSIYHYKYKNKINIPNLRHMFCHQKLEF